MHIFILFQLQCIDDFVQLCLYHSSHHNESIRKVYTNLLAILPLSAIGSSISGIKKSHVGDPSAVSALNNIPNRFVLFALIFRVPIMNLWN